MNIIFIDEMMGVVTFWCVDNPFCYAKVDAHLGIVGTKYVDEYNIL